MARRITDWLRSETLPRNAYELLGHPLFDPDRDAMLQTLRTSNREILDYQSHPEPAIAKRAIQLLTELGRYRGILEDAAKAQAYVDDVCKTLREQFVAERGPLALHAGSDLGTWLGLAYGVPSANIEAAMNAVRGTVPPPQSLPKRGSKFGAFQAPPSEPVLAEVLEEVEPPPPVVRPAVYDLSEPPPIPPKPLRRPARLEPVDRVPRRLPEREAPPSVAVPLAIGGGVLMLLAVVTTLVIMMSGDSDTTVKNIPPPEQPSPAPTSEPDPEPEPEPEPMPAPTPGPMPIPKPVPKPGPSQAELDRIKREADEQKEKQRLAAKKEMERLEAERKERERIAAEKKEMERLAAEKREMERIEAERKADERNPWIAAVRVKPANLTKIQDVRMRVHSATVQKLTEENNGPSDHPLLVVWVEVANQGTNVIQYRRLIDYQSKADDYFQYCSLRDPSNLQTPLLKRANWLTLDRKMIRELPDWFDDESPNRMIQPKRRAFIPIAFEPAKSEGKDLTLTIDAMRIISERGKDMEYGQFLLFVRDHHWKAAPPVR